jgi:hypothetical protein
MEITCCGFLDKKEKAIYPSDYLIKLCNLETEGWVAVQLHAPAALNQRKYSLLLSGRQSGYTSDPVWTLQRNEIYYPCKEYIPGLPSRSHSLYRQS